MAKKLNGNFCVYFEYRKLDEMIPQIIYSGSEKQCNDYVRDYNRQSPEKYRCKLYVGSSKETTERISELKRKFGTVDE